MQANLDPYAPPRSNVVAEEQESDTMPYFFTTSGWKLAVLSFCTLGFYELFWFYKNWVLIKERTGKNIMPFWRTFFAPLYAYSCFDHIRAAASESNVKKSLPAGFLAVLYFIAMGVSRAPDPFWLVSLFSFVFIIPANNVAVDINNKRDPEFRNNETFSGWNWLAIVIGGAFVVLILASAVLLEVPPQETTQ